MRVLDGLLFYAKSIGTRILIDRVLWVAHRALGVLVGVVRVVQMVLAVGNDGSRVNIMLKLAPMPLLRLWRYQAEAHLGVLGTRVPRLQQLSQISLLHILEMRQCTVPEHDFGRVSLCWSVLLFINKSFIGQLTSQLSLWGEYDLVLTWEEDYWFELGKFLFDEILDLLFQLLHGFHLKLLGELIKILNWNQGLILREIHPDWVTTWRCLIIDLPWWSVKYFVLVISTGACTTFVPALASHNWVWILDALLIYEATVVNAQFVSELVPNTDTESLLLHLLDGTTSIGYLRIRVESFPRHRVVYLLLELAQLSKWVLRW